MAYDGALAEQVRELLTGEPGASERAMFGGLAFLLGGHLAVTASSEGGLLLRVDPARHDELLADPRAEAFEMRGREMTGWLRIDVDATTDPGVVAAWVHHGVTYVRTLPPKA